MLSLDCTSFTVKLNCCLSSKNKQTNIKRFDYSEVKVGCIEDKTWAMIQKLFRKKNPKPECEAKTTMAYTALINNIVKLYDGKVEGDRKKNKRVYTLDTERLRVSFRHVYSYRNAISYRKEYSTCSNVRACEQLFLSCSRFLKIIGSPKNGFIRLSTRRVKSTRVC
jgi:hypothetical protein